MDGHFQGTGTLTFSDGEVQEGHFADDMLNGAASLYRNGQLIEQGTFKNSELIDGKFLSDGKWHTMENGVTGVDGVTYAVIYLVVAVVMVGVIVLIVVLVFRAMRKGANSIVKTYVNTRYPAAQPVRKAVQCQDCGATVEVVEGQTLRCPYCQSFLS